MAHTRKFNDVEYYIPDIHSAVERLRPNVRKWDLSGNTFVDWEDESGSEPPSWQEIQECLYEMYSIFEYYEYEREREKSYPTIGDQLDMLWHSMDSGEIPKATVWFDKIKEVKERIPKPEEPLS